MNNDDKTQKSKDLNDQSAKLLTAWLQSAMDIIEKNFKNLVMQIDGMESWYEADDKSLVRRPFMLTYRFGELDRLIFDENPAWKDLEPHITTNDLFRKHSSKLIGSPYGMRRAYSTRELCKFLLPRLVQVESGIRVDTKIDVDATVQKFLVVLASDTLDEVTIWPVGGVNVSNSVKLDKSTEFRELSSEEKLSCLRFGMIQGFDSGRIAPEHARWYGLVHTEVHPKVFEPMDAPPPDMMERWYRREVLLEHLLASLTIITDHRVTHAGGHSAAPSIQFGNSIPFGMSAYGAPGASFTILNGEHNPTLTPQQTQELQNYWALLKPTGLSKFQKRLINALHRYYFSQSRTKPEDMLVDLMIAAESLFLDIDKSELTYRLSLNAATWAEGDAASKMGVFTLFKKAYGLRSSVVHGNTVSRTSLLEPLEQVRVVVANAIRKAFKFSIDNPGANPEWDKMLFELASPTSTP